MAKWVFEEKEKEDEWKKSSEIQALYAHVDAHMNRREMFSLFPWQLWLLRCPSLSLSFSLTDSNSSSHVLPHVLNHIYVPDSPPFLET